MAKKSQAEVINELQYNTEVVILNNPLSAPKLIQKLGRGHGKKVQLNEIYTPKLFYDIISRITPEHSKLLEKGDTTIKVTLNIGDFLKSVNAGNSKSLYGHVIDCIDTLQSTQVKWSDSEKDYGTAIITHYEHHKRTGKIDVVLYKELVKKVVEVTQNEHFSFFKKHLYRLQNAQAIKLFPYFVSWRNRGMVEIDLVSFKRRFGCDTEGYRFFNNLKSKVLDPAINEINEKTDLTITYKLVGTNLDGARPRVTGFQFFIQEKKHKSELLESTSKLLLIESIKNENIVSFETIPTEQIDLNPDIISKYYEQIADFWGVDKTVFIKTAVGKSEIDIQKAIAYTKEQVRAGKADRPAGVFIDALRRGYITADAAKKELNEKTKTAKEKAETLKRGEVGEQEKQRQKQKELFEKQRTIFDKLIKTDETFWIDLEPLIRENNIMKNNYDFGKNIFENMQKPMIAGIVMGIAVNLRANDFGQ